MKRPVVLQPECEVEASNVWSFIRVLMWRAKLFFTFPHRGKIDYMLGEKKLFEERVWIFPRIRITIRRE